jgi:hypothetical protein
MAIFPMSGVLRTGKLTALQGGKLQLETYVSVSYLIRHGVTGIFPTFDTSAEYG